MKKILILGAYTHMIDVEKTAKSIGLESILEMPVVLSFLQLKKEGD